jgi:hypothetical protein
MHVPPVLQQGDANRANQVLSWQVLDVDAGRGYGDGERWFLLLVARCRGGGPAPNLLE